MHDKAKSMVAKMESENLGLNRNKKASINTVVNNPNNDYENIAHTMIMATFNTSKKQHMPSILTTASFLPKKTIHTEGN